ncbi:DUF1236 domain-containing protein [Rhodoplanes roseus]|uniref:DUF1236 domain-containing protein n=1 Tax=Rhodoplanes roseus TaxID=29409 RepID=A0A327KQX1_9BRAD|nr:DUF1236 domain-containing protein [Rhodoplanes roseus]RAI41289.1 hypothetical protein CH341_22015 [Rhodoplanes roseus]
METSTPEDRRGTRRLIMGGAIAAIVVGVGLVGWMVLPGYDRHQATTDATGPRFEQREGQSTVGRSTNVPPDASARSTDPISVGRNEAISATAESSVQLPPEQRDALRNWASTHADQKVERVAFTVAIGVAVPQQAELRDISPELDAALPHYKGQQYILIGDRLVVVEKQTRRVVAIIPTAA